VVVEVYPWQSTLWSQFAGRAEHAHAYLLHGPAGIGKRALAERLAAFLLCQQPGSQAACGQCKACHLLAAGTHPDYFVLEPDEEDKAIRVDQVRELVGFVVQTAQLGGRKVILLEPAEAMNLNAANALLKSLEEPAGNTVLLLVSHQPSRLLPTVRSRCVQQACPLPDQQSSLLWLAQRLPDLAPDILDTLLSLAADSPRNAERLYAQGVLEQRERVVEGLKQLIKGLVTPSRLAESWKDVPLPLLFDWFIDWAQRLLRYQLSGAEESLGLADMRKVLEYQAGKAPQQRVLGMQDWLLEQRQKVLGRANLNPALLLEALLARWASLSAKG
jgi:DNA polymerase-3 subunit delta'